MAGFTNRIERLLLDGFLGVTTYTTPTNVWLALFTADPTDEGLVTNEVANANNYVRIPLAGIFGSASGDTGISASVSDLISNISTASWGVVSHIGVMESATWGADDMVLVTEIDLAIEVLSGKSFKVIAGNLKMELD